MKTIFAAALIAACAEVRISFLDILKRPYHKYLTASVTFRPTSHTPSKPTLKL